MACFIEFLPPKGNHAGNKARVDINNICRDINLKCVEKIEEEIFFTVINKIKYMMSPKNIYKILSIVTRRTDVTILQYPFYFNPFMKYALKSYVKHNKTILLIHDVDSLRNFAKSTIQTEVSLFNEADVLIVHNAKMKEKLINIGVSVPMVELEIFDYLLDDISSNLKMEADVAFAGNLSKSVFLNELNNIGININLYGPGYNEFMKGDNVIYKGCYPPDKVPYVLDAKFGLIWDGNSLLTCNGETGEYLKYNNPHKLSLYIAAGLPVIVWDDSAIAEFVLVNNIGFTVSNIFEIKEVISNITPSEYENMKNNVFDIQKKICKGVYTKIAIQKALSMIGQK